MPARVTGRAAVALAASLAAAAALAGQPFYSEIDLAQLVARSPVIVIAHADLPRADVLIPITPKGKRPNPTRWPPFVRSRSRWHVEEVLRGPPELAGRALLVDGAEWRVHLGEHRRAWVDHLDESVPYERYQPAPAPDAGAPSAARILFLFSDRGEYAFVVDGALETIDRRARVEALIPPRR